jgi:catalase
VLDATKIVPEYLVPVRRVGKMTLNRNPDNYFSETEQVAFMTTNVVPGIDFSDDPLLQGRNFSYLDTQITRLGSPNWPQLPINRPIAPVSNNQRDGHMRYTVNPGRVSYEPNSLGGNIPNQVSPEHGGFATYAETVSGPKVRVRSESFGDHYGQARLFWNSMTPVEREHITKALQFELSKVATRDVRVRMLDHLEKINDVLAAQVALALGEPVHTKHPTATPDGTADSAAETAVLATATSATSASGGLRQAHALSQLVGQPQSPKGRKVAILATDSVDAAQVTSLIAALKDVGGQGVVVGTHLGVLAKGVEATMTLANTASVLFDAVFVPGGAQSVKTLARLGDARTFVDEAYKHAKPIAALAEGLEVLTASGLAQVLRAAGEAVEKGEPHSGKAMEVQNLAQVGAV